MSPANTKWNSWRTHVDGANLKEALRQVMGCDIAQGNGWVVDLDLEKFFDGTMDDKLMGQIAKRVEDKRLLKLIRASRFLDRRRATGLVTDRRSLVLPELFAHRRRLAEFYPLILLWRGEIDQAIARSRAAFAAAEELG